MPAPAAAALGNMGAVRGGGVLPCGERRGKMGGLGSCKGSESMDFSICAEDRLSIDAFRKYLDREVAPLARTPEEFFDKELVRGALKGLLNYGMGNGLVSEAQGGLGLSPLQVGLLFEQLAQTSPDLAIVALIQLEAGLLLADGTEDQRRRYLAPLLAGEAFACIGISEPGAGSNIAELTTRAKPVAGGYRISGEKQWISNGQFSDFILCVARLNDEPQAGLALFIVDRQAGYETRNIPKMALNRQSTAQVFFDETFVPEENLLAGAGEGLRRLTRLLAGSRPLVGLLALGIARQAFEQALDYARERRQHGKPIAAHQLIQARVADMAVDIEAARLLLYSALDKAGRDERSDLQSAMAKYFAAEAALRVVRNAVAVHGGNGVSRGFPVEELYRMAPILAVTEGTPEMQQLIIGRRLLGVSAF